MTAGWSTDPGTPLVDLIREVEDALEQADLSLVLMDKLEVRQHSDSHLHRGIVVQVPATSNTGQYRDSGAARVVDTLDVQLAYRIEHRNQRGSRDEALVLEEQIRRVLSSRVTSWDQHLTYVSTTREIQTGDRSWLVITQQFSTRRDARLGG